jgi:hypothetical protein
MKIAALALASALAAVAGSAQPSLAQGTNQNSDQSRYGQDQNRTQFDQTGSRMNGGQSNPNGSMNEENDEDSYTSGQNMNGPEGDRNGPNWNGHWRNRNAENDANEPNWGNNRPGWGHPGRRMEGRMGPPWRRHMMMGRNEGANFSFRNGNARMRIHCPPNEPLQACVNAATQLLDKIGSLKSEHAAANLAGNQTNGQGSTNMQGGNGTSANPINLPGTQPGPSNAPSANLPSGVGSGAANAPGQQ